MLPVNQFGNRCRDCSAPVAGRAWSVIGLKARMLRPSKPAFSFSQFVFRSAAAFLLLAACSVARAEDQPSVGMVTKAENEAQVDSGSGTITASVGTVVHMKDLLTTGPNGRLQVTFRDKSLLTLGENASVLIDRYVFDPDASVGEAALMSTKGALRFATGRLKAVTKKDITIATPLATLGIRGTDVWTDGTHGVLAVQPIVDVTS